MRGNEWKAGQIGVHRRYEELERRGTASSTSSRKSAEDFSGVQVEMDDSIVELSGVGWETSLGV
jgi:hypothetical protein